MKKEERFRIEEIKEAEKDIKTDKRIAIISGLVAGIGILIGIINKDVFIKDFQIHYGLINTSVQEAAQIRLKAGLFGGLTVIPFVLGSLSGVNSIIDYFNDKKKLEIKKENLKIK